ncbi:transposase [Flavobacterium paronense]|nr:transposase [Flavobacterium paronense]MDN3675997.1 transposase [Flavobacterium paronense]
MIKVSKLNQRSVLLCLKIYTINQTTLPLDMDQFISETDVVFAVHSLVEAIPQKLFHQLEQPLGRPAYHPKMMLKSHFCVCVYHKKLFSGRRMEFLLEDSYRMRWLANHEQIVTVPSIVFVAKKNNSTTVSRGFCLFRRQLITNQVIENEAIFIDGTKIEADARKFSFVWRKINQSV